MKAAVIRQHGGLEVLQFEERPDPHPGPNQILVRVRACGLNHLDLWVRKGVSGHTFPLPLVPGSDIAGIIEETGTGVVGFNKGDRVIVDPGVACGSCTYCQEGRENLCAKWGLLGETTDGGCQEKIVVHEAQVHRLPEGLNFEQGACIPIAYVTAWQMLVKKAHIQPGQTILIHAAGSGVSIACIQIAKMHGLQVFVTSRSEEKLKGAKNLGADRFILSSKEPFREAVKNLTGKQGIDIVVDHVGGTGFMDSIRCLKRGGTLVSCGATAGSDLHLDWKHVFFKNLALLGSTYGTRKDFTEVLSAFSAGLVHPVIEQIFSFSDLPKAHAMLEDRRVFGKVIVTF